MTVPIGRPIANTSIFILDEMLRPVPPGVIGELHIGGVGLARGYLNRPELTAEKFIEPEAGPLRGVRLYKSGDRARFKENGLIDYLGRTDHQIKLRGMRVELGEIEAILNQNASISQAIVVTREDMPGNLYLAAYCVLHDQNLDETPLQKIFQEQLERTLPSHMIPSVFVVLNEFPLMHNGKVDRKKLPVPPTRTTGRVVTAQALTSMERRIADIWKNLLNVDVIGVNDNFFELGGNSLLVVRMLGQLKKEISADVAVADFFRTPTIHALAQVIEIVGVNDQLIVRLQDGDNIPLFLIHPVGGHLMGYRGLLKCLNYAGSVYGIQHPDLASNTDPIFRTVEELATRYVDAVITIAPHGPYRLCGWSFGGLVALEMVKLFQKRGEYVEYIGLIDSMILDAQARDWASNANDGAVVKSQIEKLPQEALIASSTILANTNELKDATNSGSEFYEIFEAVFFSNLWAAASYQPDVSLQAIYFYRASKSCSQPGYNESFEKLGKLSQDNIYVRDFSADHYSLLDMPVVNKLAKTISDDLLNLTLST